MLGGALGSGPMFDLLLAGMSVLTFSAVACPGLLLLGGFFYRFSELFCSNAAVYACSSGRLDLGPVCPFAASHVVGGGALHAEIWAWLPPCPAGFHLFVKVCLDVPCYSLLAAVRGDGLALKGCWALA